MNAPEDPTEARDPGWGGGFSARSDESGSGDAEAVTEVVSSGADAVTEVVVPQVDAVTDVGQSEPPVVAGAEAHHYPLPSPEWLLLSGPQPAPAPELVPPVFQPPKIADAAGPRRPARRLGVLLLGATAVVVVAVTAVVSIWLTSDRTAASVQAGPSTTSTAVAALQGGVVSSPRTTTGATPGRSSAVSSPPLPTSRPRTAAAGDPSPPAGKPAGKPAGGDPTQAAPVKICARGHVENAGWQPWACVQHGQRLTVGTIGQVLRLEAIEVYTVGAGGVCLNAHEQDTGWQGQTCQADGVTATAGTTAQSRRMEALQIQTGRGVCARGHVQNIGWQAQVCAGPNAPVQVGTTGQGLRLEAVELSV